MGTLGGGVMKRFTMSVQNRNIGIPNRNNWARSIGIGIGITGNLKSQSIRIKETATRPEGNREKWTFSGND